MGGGTCGPSAIAAGLGLSTGDVLDMWRGRGGDAFRGFSPIREMQETIRALGYDYTYVRANKSTKFPTPRTNMAILRIQWLKEDGTDYYWAARGPNSHYVLIKLLDDGWWVYCDGTGWFPRDSETGTTYLPGRGYVSSYMELTRL